MNKLIIIGNLTRDPEIRDVSGVSVCTFTVAVNRRVKAGAHPEADYVRVTAWRGLADNCYKYLAKGRKVCVAGPARAYGYNGNDGSVRAYMELTADDVEFLSARGRDDGEPPFEETDNSDVPEQFMDD